MKNIILFIFGISILMIGGLFVLSLSTKNSGKEIVSYRKTEEVRPKAVLPETETDLGTISVKQEVSKDFVVRNTGGKPLQISKINSSCNCTTARFIYNGQESAEFGMHNPGQEIYEIAPGTEATIKVIYRPYVMPVYGFVSREVYAETNDPDLPRIVLRVKTIVNK